MYDWTATTMLGGMGLSNTTLENSSGMNTIGFFEDVNSAAKIRQQYFTKIYSAFELLVIRLKGKGKSMCQ